MNRFFRATAERYEAIRASMDSQSGFPSSQAETWFAPADQAPRDTGGLCLIAAIPPIADRFAAEGAKEITAEEFATSLPAPEI